MTTSTLDRKTEAAWRDGVAGPPVATHDEAAERKRRAFEAEALPHLDALYRVALSLAGDPARAEDWVQETMLRAYRSWHTYRPGTNVRAWLVTILRNTFISDYRSARRAESVDLALIERVSVLEGAHDTNPEDEYFRDMVDGEILDEIGRLSGKLREILLLSDLKGLAQAEIAQVTGVPIGTVKSRLHRARTVLQRRLHRYAVERGYLRPSRAVSSRRRVKSANG